MGSPPTNCSVTSRSPRIRQNGLPVSVHKRLRLSDTRRREIREVSTSKTDDAVDSIEDFAGRSGRLRHIESGDCASGCLPGLCWTTKFSLASY